MFVCLFVCSAPFKSAVKNVVKKEKIVGGLLSSAKTKKGGVSKKIEKQGNQKKNKKDISMKV